jgi:hypothetical protein
MHGTRSSARWFALPIAAVMLVPAAGVIAQSPAPSEAPYRQGVIDPATILAESGVRGAAGVSHSFARPLQPDATTFRSWRYPSRRDQTPSSAHLLAFSWQYGVEPEVDDGVECKFGCRSRHSCQSSPHAAPSCRSDSEPHDGPS